MGGMKGRSGPPGNTNASRYAWRTLTRRGLLREQDQWVGRPLDLYVQGLLSDKPEATAGERNIIEIAATAKACVLLIMSELKKSGFTHTVGGAVELTPAARELRSFLQTEIQALRVLGLGRRAKPVQGLESYLENRPYAEETPLPEVANGDAEG